MGFSSNIPYGVFADVLILIFLYDPFKVRQREMTNSAQRNNTCIQQARLLVDLHLLGKHLKYLRLGSVALTANPWASGLLSSHLVVSN